MVIKTTNGLPQHKCGLNLNHYETIERNYALKINRQLAYLLTAISFLALQTSYSKDDKPGPVTLSGISPERGEKSNNNQVLMTHRFTNDIRSDSFLF